MPLYQPIICVGDVTTDTMKSCLCTHPFNIWGNAIFLMLSIESTNSSVGKDITPFIVSANLFANFDSTMRYDKSKEKGTGSFFVPPRCLSIVNFKSGFHGCGFTKF